MESEEENIELAIQISLEESMSEMEKNSLRLFMTVVECNFSVAHQYLSNNEFSLEDSLSAFYMENSMVPFLSVPENRQSGMRGKKIDVKLTPDEDRSVFKGTDEIFGLDDFLGMEEDGFDLSYLLLQVAREGDLESLRILLGLKFVEKNIEDENGRNVFHFASLGGHVEIFEELLRHNELSELIDEKDNKGVSAMRIAVMRGFPWIVKILTDFSKSSNIAITESSREEDHQNMPGLVWLGVYSDICFQEVSMTHQLVRNVNFAGNPFDKENGIFLDPSLVDLAKRNNRVDISRTLTTIFLSIASLQNTVGSVVGMNVNCTPPQKSSLPQESEEIQIGKLIISLYDNRCHVCNKSGSRKCGKCCAVVYCSKICQSKDSREHQKKCNEYYKNKVVHCLKEVGDVCAKSGAYQRAIRMYGFIIRLNGENSKRNFLTHFNRGYSYEMLKMTNQALEEYTKAITVDPEHGLVHVAWNNRGNVYYSQTKFQEKAIEDFSMAIKLKHDYIPAYENRAIVYLKTKRFQESILEYTKIIKFNPHDFKAYCNSGNAFMHLNQYKEAMNDANQAVLLNPRDSISRLFRGRLRCFMGEHVDLVMEDIESSIQLNPNLSCDVVYSFFDCNSACKKASFFKSEGDDERALETLNFCLKMTVVLEKSKLISYFFAKSGRGQLIADVKNNITNLYSTRGEVLLGMKRYEDCLKDLMRVLNQKPNDDDDDDNNNILVTQQCGIALQNLGRYEEAIDFYTRSIGEFESQKKEYRKVNVEEGIRNILSDQEASVSGPRMVMGEVRELMTPKAYITCYLNRGNIYRILKKFDEALLDYGRVIDMDEKNYKAFNNIGVVYRDLSKLDKAMEYYQKAVELKPDYADVYNNIGSVYHMRRNYVRAFESYQKAIELNPSHSYPLCNLGMVFHLLGEIERGELYFKKALSDNPNDFHVYKQRALSNIQTNQNIERALQDYCTIFNQFKPKYKEDVYELMDINEVYKRLEKSYVEKTSWDPFLKDNKRDYAVEVKELESVRRIISNTSFNDLKIFRKLGSGTFGATYLCQITNVTGIFVLKLVKDRYMEESKRKELIEKDSLNIPYHCNLVSVIHHTDIDTEILFTKLPDYESFWKSVLMEDQISSKGGLVFMKYYPMDLLRFITLRVKNKVNFTMLEVCRILGGLLEGVNHLQIHRIVHRDLKPDNIFLDPLYGRLYIGDFGCCVDNRGEPKSQGLNVHFSKTVLYSNYFEKGGNPNFLPPEVVDFDFDAAKKKEEEEEEEREETEGEEDFTSKISFIDYSKSDLFSVGMIGYYLIDSFDEDVSLRDPLWCAPFGISGSEDDEGPVVVERKQSNYIELNEVFVDKAISEFIKKLLFVDISKRPNCEQAIAELKSLWSVFEKEEKNMKERMDAKTGNEPFLKKGKRYGVMNPGKVFF